MVLGLDRLGFWKVWKRKVTVFGHVLKGWVLFWAVLVGLRILQPNFKRGRG